MIDIRPFRSKSKGIRIDIYRKIDHIDPATHKSKPFYRQVGSFSLSKGVTADLMDLLEPSEKLQLHNWLTEAQFAAQYDQSEADDLIKLPLRVPKKFYQRMVDLHSQSAKKGELFIPNHIMLSALDQVMKQYDLQPSSLSKVTEHAPPTCPHERITRPQRQLINDEVDNTCRMIFKQLLEIPIPIGQLCTQLEHAALTIGKDKRITPKILHDWANSSKISKSDQQPKRWHFAIVIDVLKKNGVDPITLIGAKYTAAYYAVPRKGFLSKESTKKKFFATFQLTPDQKATATQAIEAIYNETDRPTSPKTPIKTHQEPA